MKIQKIIPVYGFVCPSITFPPHLHFGIIQRTIIITIITTVTSNNSFKKERCFVQGFESVALHMVFLQRS
ncbi:hypothetical protein L6452_22688 [Arctium lappa]|uniref:Uncharacterized protein n=1 Tax=Arctium lappa TaxID=4217 RepID=A0ACB9AZM5_ARCLA|nr:hypothetical protein L6452_22688 [Arctium lappa]